MTDKGLGWTSYEHDPYLKEGFIEVVGDAETICKIQMAAQRSFKSTAAFRRGLLLEWIVKHNPGPEQGGDSIVYVANICVRQVQIPL